MNKETFCKALRRFQNYRSHKETKNKLLEKAFGSDTTIFDFDGLDEILETIIDMSCIMFPNLLKEEIKEDIEWYVYEAVNMENPTIEDDKNNKWIVKAPEALYEMMCFYNNN